MSGGCVPEIAYILHTSRVSTSQENPASARAPDGATARRRWAWSAATPAAPLLRRRRGERRSERLTAMAREFASGNAELEVVETYASADLIVLVFVERQRGRFGRLPEQDWSLRVTQVYRRRGGAWEFTHRHADPLVRNVGLEKTAALARGD